MNDSILNKLLGVCPFQETLDDGEMVEGCSFPVPKLKIGHLRADHDGWRWHNTVWPCHRALATPEICKEIDCVYDKLTASDALKDLPALRRFCSSHMETCIDKEYHEEFSFFYTGEHCDFWIRLITRKGDYNMYLNAYAKGQNRKKYFNFLEKLRESGETNVYGAVPYLQDNFRELRYALEDAKRILLDWFKTFEEKGANSEC